VPVRRPVATRTDEPKRLGQEHRIWPRVTGLSGQVPVPQPPVMPSTTSRSIQGPAPSPPRQESVPDWERRHPEGVKKVVIVRRSGFEGVESCELRVAGCGLQVAGSRAFGASSRGIPMETTHAVIRSGARACAIRRSPISAMHGSRLPPPAPTRRLTDVPSSPGQSVTCALLAGGKCPRLTWVTVTPQSCMYTIGPTSAAYSAAGNCCRLG